MTDGFHSNDLTQLAQKHIGNIMDEFEYGRDVLTLEGVSPQESSAWLIRFRVADQGVFEITVVAQAEESDDQVGYRIAEEARNQLLRCEALSKRYGYEM